MRKRNTILAALECFRDISPTVVLSDLVVFLYVCENEGLNVTELAHLARMTEASASRRARAMGPPDMPYTLAPSMDLIGGFQGVDGRERLMYLTEKGVALRARLDDIIARAQPISTGVKNSHDALVL